MGKTREEATTVAETPIKKQPKSALYLRQSGAEGELPSGRRFDIGSTCGFGGVELVIVVYGKDGDDASETFTISARDAIEVLIAKGLVS